MKELISEEQALLEQFRRSLWPAVSFHQDELLPPVVYHYTTASGFVGIMNDQYLRATNFSYLNDPSEMQFGRELIEKNLTRRNKDVGKRLNTFFGYVLSSLEVENAAEVYVASFTKLEDDLSQWRAYGTSMSERYAIGFDGNAINELRHAKPSDFFGPVKYKTSDQQAKIDYAIDRSLQFLDKHRVPAADFQPFADVTARELASIMPVLKNQAFQMEQEWRVIIRSTEGNVPEFDTARGVIRPFVPLRFGSPLPILGLTVLAPARLKIALKAAEMVLQAHGIDVIPEHSKIPFAE